MVCSKHVMSMSPSPASSNICSGPPFLSTSLSTSAQGIFEVRGGARE